MKHLFFVHSHITFLVANQYIIDNKINHDDCLFILCNRYPKLPEGYLFKNIILYPNDLFTEGITRVFQNNNVILGFKNIRLVESIINSYFNFDSFMFYTPNTNYDLHSVIATMQQCKGYYLVEEGTASYCPQKDLPRLVNSPSLLIIKWFLRPLLKRFYYLKTSNYATDNKKYLGTIASSERAFIDFSGKHILVSCPFIKVKLETIPDIILSIDASLFICMDYFPDRLYAKLFDYLVNVCDYKLIGYKFHPNYNSNPRIIDQYRNGLSKIFGNKAFEISDGYPLENIFCSYPIDFCSDNSSVGIYASNQGRKCLSYLYLVPYYYPETYYKRLFIDTLPQITKDSYSFILPNS